MTSQSHYWVFLIGYFDFYDSKSFYLTKICKKPLKIAIGNSTKWQSREKTRKGGLQQPPSRECERERES